MTLACCPNCGTNLSSFDATRFGNLFIDKGSAFIWWRERPVPLTPSERLIVTALARADGAPIARHILADAAGSDSDAPAGVANVHLTRIKSKFRRLDAGFDHIESVRGMGVRWRA